MARRADHSREELTELALHSAIQIIDEKGFSGFSARGVAKEIGYTVGTLYNVFGSFDQMILQINGRTLDVWHEMLVKAVKTKQGLPALHTLAKAYLAFSRDYQQRWAMLFDATDNAREIPEWYQDKLDSFFMLVETLLLPLVQNNNRLARETARVLWAGIHGICVLANTNKLALTGAESAEKLSRTLIDTYMQGLQY